MPRIDAWPDRLAEQRDEALTIGTLPDYAVVAPKDLIATIKIIRSGPRKRPVGSRLWFVKAVRDAAPFRHLNVGLVVTELPA
jgi:molybdenum cofactor cytidylyltransferase